MYINYILLFLNKNMSLKNSSLMCLKKVYIPSVKILKYYYYLFLNFLRRIRSIVILISQDSRFTLLNL